jgi:type VI secretion system secreted protein Hcp
MKRLPRATLALAVVLATFGMVSAASAANDFFLKIPGVDGESVDKSHPNEIVVLSWSWGMSNVVSISGGGGGAGKVSMQNLTLTKTLDKASPLLMLTLCRGTHYTEAVLTVRRVGANPFEYLKITLNDVLVTSVSTGGTASDDRPTEEITLAFTKVAFEYTPQKADGSSGTPIRFGWDVSQNTSF